MSRARHKRHEERAAGGKVVAYSGGESNVMKEAHERKRGGRVKHHHEGEGEEGKHHAGKRKRGGKVEAMGHGHHHSAHHEAGHHGHHRKHGGKVEHDEHGHHHEHKKRARGGAIGSDHRPLSSAAVTKKMPEEKGGGAGAGPANEQTDH